MAAVQPFNNNNNANPPVTVSSPLVTTINVVPSRDHTAKVSGIDDTIYEIMEGEKVVRKFQLTSQMRAHWPSRHCCSSPAQTFTDFETATHIVVFTNKRLVKQVVHDDFGIALALQEHLKLENKKNGGYCPAMGVYSSALTNEVHTLLLSTMVGYQSAPPGSVSVASTSPIMAVPEVGCGPCCEKIGCLARHKFRTEPLSKSSARFKILTVRSNHDVDVHVPHAEIHEAQCVFIHALGQSNAAGPASQAMIFKQK